MINFENLNIGFNCNNPLKYNDGWGIFTENRAHARRSIKTALLNSGTPFSLFGGVCCSFTCCDKKENR